MSQLYSHLVWAFALLVCLFSFTTAEPSCINITIPVAINANNVDIPSDFNISDTTQFTNLVENPTFNLTVNGTFNIAARYCQPEVLASYRQNSLQLLVHGLGYTRNYWSGDATPGSGNDSYSWVAYASKQGYPTLSIDRLGNGLSDHPDPIRVVQVPTQIETIHEIVVAARAGAAPFPRAFKTIILGGHSLGSIVNYGLNAKYPSDVDVSILTGFSKSVLSGAAFGSLGALPADTVDAAKNGDLPEGYLETTNETTTLALYYWGPGVGYDLAFAHQDFLRRGTFSIGEAITLYITTTQAPWFKGPVYVVTGQHDAAFCDGDCGPNASGYLSQVETLYPSAKTFQWYAPPSSGHCINLHYEAPITFALVHVWLQRQGF